MRLFLALEIPWCEEWSSLISTDSLRQPTHHHLTIQFFGNLEHDDLTWIKQKLDSFSFKSFSFKTNTKLSAFANWDRCRTVYIGVDSRQLTRLASQLQSLFRDRFVAKEFVPHITIGRVKGELSEDALNGFQKVTLEPREICVSELCLFESVFNNSGVSYNLLKKVKLT